MTAQVDTHGLRIGPVEKHVVHEVVAEVAKSVPIRTPGKFSAVKLIGETAGRLVWGALYRRVE